jgi:prepilin-type N-terminal cleavage/methylation domain-containing protein
MKKGFHFSFLRKNQEQAGFTLIELLVVILIIATLSVGVYVALNPTKRLEDTRNATRTTDVQSILTAIHQYIVDQEGSLPGSLGTTEQQLGTNSSGCAVSTGGCSTAASCLDLSTPLAPYLKSIPVDPLSLRLPQNAFSLLKEYSG